MSEYSIATHALPAPTVAALRSMLKTLAPMLGTRWEVRDQLPADVLMAPAEMLARLPPVPRHSKLPLFVALAADDAQLAIAFASIKRPVSPPRLLEAIQAVAEQTGRYRLLRWPDFGRLPHSHAEVRLASFLMTQPMTLAELGARTDVSRERAMNFLNAVYGLGLLAPADAGIARRIEKSSARPMMPGLAALISQLRRKFGFTRSERADSV